MPGLRGRSGGSRSRGRGEQTPDPGRRHTGRPRRRGGNDGVRARGEPCSDKRRRPGVRSASRWASAHRTPTGTTRRSTASRWTCWCSATRSPQASARTGPGHPRRRLARGIASSAGRSVRLRTAAVVGSESSDARLPARLPAAGISPGRGRDRGRRQRRHPPGAGRRVRTSPGRGRSRTSGPAGRRGRRRHLPGPRGAPPGAAAPARARLACLAAAGGGPAGGGPGVRRPGGLAGARGGPVLLPPSRRRCSASTASTRARTATSGRRRRCSRRCSRPSASWPTCRSGTTHPRWVGQARVPGCAPLLDEPARPSRRLPRRPAGCRHRPHRPSPSRSTRRPSAAAGCWPAT